MSVAMFIVLFAGIIGLAATHPARRRQWWLIAICVAFPLTITMVLHAWVDIYSVALFAIWAALRRRHSALASIALGVSFAAKLTIVPALIPFWLWSSKVRREGAIAVLVATAIALPFAIATGIGDFVQDVFRLFVNLPMRFEFVTIHAYLYHHGQGPLDSWVGVLAVVVVAGLILWRKPRDLGDAFVSSALLLTIFYFFAAQAPINYYFVPITMLLLALATRGLPLDAAENIHLPRPFSTAWLGYFGRRPVVPGTPTCVPEAVPMRLVARPTDLSRVETALSTVDVAPPSGRDSGLTGNPPPPLRTSVGAGAAPTTPIAGDGRGGGEC